MHVCKVKVDGRSVLLGFVRRMSTTKFSLQWTMSTICPFFYYSEDARTAHLPKPNRWKINKFNACMLNVGSLATVVQY